MLVLMWVNNSTKAFRHQIGWIQQVAFQFFHSVVSWIC